MHRIIENILVSLRDESGLAGGTPDNWSNEDIAELIQEGITEILLSTTFATTTLYVPLMSGYHVYLLTPPGYLTLGITRLKHRGTSRFLEQTSLHTLARKDGRWLTTTGTPFQFVQLDFTKLLVYPKPVEEGLVLEAEVKLLPEAFDKDGLNLSVPNELEQGLIHYVRSHLLVKMPDRIEEAFKEYQEFMTILTLFPELRRRMSRLTRRVIKSVLNDND